MSEWFDLYWYKFDLFIAEDCGHFISTEDNPYMETMMKIQSYSTIIVFMMIHIPLSRLHSSVSFLTSFLPLFCNMRTKYWFHEKANNLICIIYKNDKEAKNHLKKPKEQSFPEV